MTTADRSRLLLSTVISQYIARFLGGFLLTFLLELSLLHAPDHALPDITAFAPRSLFAVARPSVCRVCNARAPYSGG